jgi:hypothetical protein
MDKEKAIKQLLKKANDEGKPMSEEEAKKRVEAMSPSELTKFLDDALLGED